MELLHSGKVREVYLDRGEIVLVASDRVSVYDVVLPTPIPDKGALLTQLSLWWFARTADLVPNHVISGTDVPPEIKGRAVRCRRLEMLPVECIARGYLTGLGLREYQRTGSVSGLRLPDGLVEGDRLPEPIFTPTTKAPAGQHDEFLTFDDVVALVGGPTAEALRAATLALYRRGAEVAAANGVLMADTKFEFGRPAGEPEGESVPGDDEPDGESVPRDGEPGGGLVLGDEIFTSDSSRYWPADEWRPGRPQRSFDKQIVRDWAAGTGWDKTPPGPAIPPEIVELTRNRYIELYQRLTGQTWG